MSSANRLILARTGRPGGLAGGNPAAIMDRFPAK